MLHCIVQVQVGGIEVGLLSRLVYREAQELGFSAVNPTYAINKPNPWEGIKRVDNECDRDFLAPTVGLAIRRKFY